MGCDIHLYVEHRSVGSHNWVSMFHKFSHRNYNLFAKLANERNYDGITPICPVRGFPEDASPSVDHEYYFEVSDTAEDPDYECRVMPRSVAANWVAAGMCKYCKGSSHSIDDPDFHTPSWLTAAEFCEAVKSVASADLYWVAVSALVDTIAKRSSVEDCRVVFWFDN